MGYDDSNETIPGLRGIIEEALQGQQEEVTARQAGIHNVSTAICLSMITEIERANEKYPDYFRTSKEALGVIREEYLEVEELLRKVKSKDSPNLENLKAELRQLGAMCIKATYSICNMEAEIGSIDSFISAQKQDTTEEPTI